MTAISRYQPLADYLADKKVDSWEATFQEVEAKLGRSLPPSAYRHQAWWANQTGPGHSQTHGWRSVGWRTTRLDLERSRVRFERERSLARAQAGDASLSPGPASDLADLVERAMEVTGLSDPDALIAAALREFIAQAGVRGAIELGGSAPDFEAAPRNRAWS